MSKKKRKKGVQHIQKQDVPDKKGEHILQEKLSDIPPRGLLDKLSGTYIPYVIIALFSLILYVNTFQHGFALDDDIVICKNEYVLKGVSGFPDIFSKDLFASFYEQMNTTAQLAGGRYRPLSVATFAIEQEFIGTRESPVYAANCWDKNGNGQLEKSEDMNGDGLPSDKDCRTEGFMLRHIDNVLLYALACCLMYLFLSTVPFKKNKALALIATLLFTAHPIHTEVVANVKSRDEIMCFLFMMLTLWLVHMYARKSGIKYLLLTVLSLFAGLLSKEYAATLLILVPLSLYLFEPGFVIKKYGALFGGMVAAFAVYYLIRSGIVIGASNLQDKELMNNPYLLASDEEHLATRIFILLKYLSILIFPVHLISDYGYHSIPYKNFGDIQVWLSILISIGMIAGLWISFKKRHFSAFAIAFYILNILLVTNLIFNVGATMGERLAFHSSFGFCILLAWLLDFFAQKFQKKEYILYLAIPALLLYSYKTIARNPAWKDDVSLALTDVEQQPNSIALNGNACSRNLDLSEQPRNKAREKELIGKAIRYGEKSVQLHPSFVNGLLNLGICYAKEKRYEDADSVWTRAFQIYPHHPSKPQYYSLLAESYFKEGYDFGATQNWTEGVKRMEKAVQYNPSNAQYWYHLGGFAYNAKNYMRAKEAWSKAYELSPNDTSIQKVQGILR